MESRKGEKDLYILAGHGDIAGRDVQVKMIKGAGVNPLTSDESVIRR